MVPVDNPLNRYQTLVFVTGTSIDDQLDFENCQKQYGKMDQLGKEKRMSCGKVIRRNVFVMVISLYTIFINIRLFPSVTVTGTIIRFSFVIQIENRKVICA